MVVAIVIKTPDIPSFNDSSLALKVASVPDNENGFILLANTVGTAKNSNNKPPQTVSKNNPVKDRRNPTDKESAKLTRIFADKIYAVRQATEKKYFLADFNILPYANIDFEKLDKYTAVNVCLAWGEIRKGNKKSAVDRLLTNLKLSNALLSANGGLTLPMLAVNINRKTFSEISAMLDQNLLAPEDIKTILNTTENEESIITRGYQKAISAEYMNNKSIFRRSALSNPFLIEGLIDLTEFISSFVSYRENMSNKVYFEYFTKLINGSGKAYSETKINDPEIASIYKQPNGRFKVFMTGNSFGYDIFVNSALRTHKMGYARLHIAKAETVLFKTKAALALYKIHNGTLPDDLTALVPDYMKSFPPDPFDGKPLRYSKQKNVIYSVGFNLKDDKGAANRYIFAPDRAKTTKKKHSPIAYVQEKDLALPLMPQPNNSK